MKRPAGLGASLLLASFCASGCLSGGFVQGSGPRVVVDNSRGKMTVNYKHTEAELGVPFYPGSKPFDDGSIDMEVQGLTLMVQMLTTEDPLEKVTAFYTTKLGQPEHVGPGLTGENETAWSYQHSNGTGQSVSISGGVDKKPVIISISVFMPPKDGG